MIAFMNICSPCIGESITLDRRKTNFNLYIVNFIYYDIFYISKFNLDATTFGLTKPIPYSYFH